MKKILLSVLALGTIATLIAVEPKRKLSDFRQKVYSQFGEDGVIEEIMRRIAPTAKVCVEFGAHDGLYCSNTANLWRNQGWNAILIEPNLEVQAKLSEHTRGFNVTVVKEFVMPTGTSTIDNIVNRIDPKLEIDLLSMDIDGNDYHILNSLQSLHPKVIICEFNPTVAAELDVYQEYSGENFGCSVGALKRVANEKGYFLAAITDINVFFIANEYKDLFADLELSLDKIRDDKYVKHIFFDMIGRPVIMGETSTYNYGIHPINASGTNANLYFNGVLNHERIRISRWDRIKG